MQWSAFLAWYFWWTYIVMTWKEISTFKDFLTLVKKIRRGGQKLIPWLFIFNWIPNSFLAFHSLLDAVFGTMEYLWSIKACKDTNSNMLFLMDLYYYDMKGNWNFSVFKEFLIFAPKNTTGVRKYLRVRNKHTGTLINFFQGLRPYQRELRLLTFVF